MDEPKSASNAFEQSLGVPNDCSDEPVFAEDGTDLTLIRESLAKTPEERIQALQAAIRSIYRLRDAVRT